MIDVLNIGITTLAVFAITMFFFVNFAKPVEYAAPDISEYLESLKQPDNIYGASCCGEGDAYWADKTEECPIVSETCALIAIVTDDRGDTIKTSSGKEITRHHVDNGAKIIIPKSKIRRPPSENPTDHNIIFISTSDTTICWEPSAGG